MLRSKGNLNWLLLVTFCWHGLKFTDSDNHFHRKFVISEFFKRNKQQSGTIKLSENIWFIGVFIKSKSASADEREDFTRKNTKLRLANLLNVM